MMLRSTVRSTRRPLAFVLLASALVLGGCSSDDDDDDGASGGNGDGDGTATTFIVPLAPENEVPPVTADDATGEGNLQIDTETGAVEGSLMVSGLSGSGATAAHIHQGFAGTNGDILVTLDGEPGGTTWSVPEDTVLDAVGLDALLNGGLYLNVHTDANPGGEVRGQIVPDDIEVATTALSGDNEVPAVATDASAIATTTVNPETGAIVGVIATTGLDDATAAHIHTGAAGENGDVIIGLEQSADDTSLWQTPEGSTLTDEQLDAFDDDGLYYNVHTPANPDGEVRGQL